MPSALAGLIREADETHLVGCGTAAHAALAGQYLLARIAGQRAFYANGSEFGYLEKFLGRRALAVALSQSGETIDVIDSVRSARRREAPSWRRSSTSRARRCTACPTTRSCWAPARSAAYSRPRLHRQAGRPADDGVRARRATSMWRPTCSSRRRRRHRGDAPRRRRDHIRQIAERIYLREHLFVIGRGPSYPMALEAALKIKEVSYVHAEGFAGGELKHGVIALIEPGTPCLVLAPHDETRDDILSGAMEMKARGGLIIGIGPTNDDGLRHPHPGGGPGRGDAIVKAVPAQLLGYYLALLRGHDPDKPRNLAKSVTVK